MPNQPPRRTWTWTPLARDLGTLAAASMLAGMTGLLLFAWFLR